MNIKNLLKLSSDSEKMPGINDMLSIQVRNTRQKIDGAPMRMLEEEDLAHVAGGFAAGGGGPCACGSYNVISTGGGKWMCLDCGRTW